MGTPSSGMGTPTSGGGYNYGNPMSNSGTGGPSQGTGFNAYGGYGGGMAQQPAYGMGTGGQYSPQLRQAQNAWQQQAGYGTGGGQQPMYGMGQMRPQEPMMTAEQYMASLPPGSPIAGSDYSNYVASYQMADQIRNAGPAWGGMSKSAALALNPNAQPYGTGSGWGGLPGPGETQVQRLPYGMGAQGMGNAYGYGGQQGNPWAPQYQQAPQTQGSTSLAPPAAPSMSQAQPAMQAPAPPPPPPPAPRPAAAVPARANYSPSNPYGGLYANPQADAWEQQQRSGGLPAPVAPQTDVMRKALSGVDNGYGYGTPGGYQLDTAPSTLDPGSMNGLLGFLGGNINGVGYPTSAANYANWYQQTYGQQAPGGPKAYPF